jgi:hypothetical protein
MGNPLLKPARTSNVEFTYVLKQKYIFQVSYYRVDDFFVSQSYQMPDELKLLYKSFNIDYTSNLNFTSIIPFSIGKWYNSNFIVSAYNERYKSNDWYGYKYDRDKWTGMFMLNNTFNISQKPKLSANLMLFYKTPTIQGIWDLGSNWCVNAGIKYSFLKDWGFYIELDLLNMPSNMLDWANTLNAKDLLIKPKSLKYGAVYLAGELDGQWGGMTIIKH